MTATKPRHRAINKITTFLHMLLPDGVDADSYRDDATKSGYNDLPPQARKISEYARTRLLPTTTQTPALVQLLNNAPPAEPLRNDTVLDLTRKKPRVQCNKALKEANVCNHITVTGTLPQLFAPYRKPYPQTAWEVYQRIPKPRGVNSHGVCDKHTEARWALFNLYTAHDGDKISNIVALQQARDRSAAATAAQTQALVDWAPKVLPCWTVTLGTHLGYNIATQTPATETEVMTEGVDTGCERCITQETTSMSTEQDLPACDACCCSFQSQYLTAAEEDRHKAAQHDDPWYCDLCHGLKQSWETTHARQPTSQEMAAMVPPELQWCRVRWQPSPEPLEHIRDQLARQPDGQALLQQLLDQQAQPAVRKQTDPTPHYHNIPVGNLAKQGIYPEHQHDQCRYNVTHGQDIRDLLHIHPAAVKPQTDIAATRRFEVYIRTVESIHKSAACKCKVACLYKPDGTCPDTLPADQMHTLYSRYQHAAMTDPTHHVQQSAGDFAQDLYQLITRYANAAPCKGTPAGVITTKGEWSLPPGILSAAMEHTGANAERYASPLNAHLSIQTYYTPFKADALFGSQGDTHQYTWRINSSATP
jgi:hypothetical protein